MGSNASKPKPQRLDSHKYNTVPLIATQGQQYLILKKSHKVHVQEFPRSSEGVRTLTAYYADRISLPPKDREHVRLGENGAMKPASRLLNRGRVSNSNLLQKQVVVIYTTCKFSTSLVMMLQRKC